MKRGTAWIVSGVCVLLWNAAPIRAQIRESDQALAQQVFKKLLSVAPGKQTDWPPVLIIEDKSEINAFATLQRRDGKLQPVVVCSNALLQKVVDGNADRLAFILGHEIGHHILGHPQAEEQKTGFLQATFSRTQELDADHEGMELAVKAGYSFPGGLSGIRKMIDLGLNYSSFEGLSTDHPSWDERIALLDKQQANLWRSLGAFEDGTYFLVVQNYPLAQRAFRQVTKEFPDSDEAWANLGYAMLMEYADSLDESDLQHFNIGQIVAGGFYKRSKSLEAHVRGVNEELWWDAVGALREAIRLNPSLSLPNANLGIAYLLRPAGKDPGKAAESLEEASKLAPTDASLDPVSRLAEQANLAVAYSAGGDSQKALEELAQVDRSLHKMESPATVSIANAVDYNRAFLLAQSPDTTSQKTAFEALAKFLKTADPSGMWWNAAYSKYSDLSKQFGITPESASHVHSDLNLHFRPVTDLNINSWHMALGDKIVDTTTHLAPAPTVSAVVPRTNLLRYDFTQLGVSVIGTDQVLAIVLSGKNAPAISLHEVGLGNRSHEIHIGMSTEELDHLMQDANYDFRQLTDPDVNYRFYQDLGLAILIKNKMITEVVISQIPNQDKGLI